MLPAGASEGDGQITLALSHIVRQQIDQDIGDARDELPRLGKRADVLRDFRMLAGVRPKLRHEMGIRQKTDVEDKVGFLGHAVFVPKADARNQDVLVGALALKALGYVRSQL